MKFLLHTKMAWNMRVSHDFDLRSFGQVYGHWEESAKFGSGPYQRTLELSTSQKDCWRPKDVSWFWSKVILASSKSLEGEAHSFFCLYTFLSKFLLNVKFVYDLRCHEPWISCTSLRSLFKNKSIFEI